MIVDIDVDDIFKNTYPFKILDCYKELKELGFDFEKNSAKCFIECLNYIYSDRYCEDIPF